VSINKILVYLFKIVITSYKKNYDEQFKINKISNDEIVRK